MKVRGYFNHSPTRTRLASATSHASRLGCGGSRRQSTSTRTRCTCRHQARGGAYLWANGGIPPHSSLNRTTRSAWNRRDARACRRLEILTPIIHSICVQSIKLENPHEPIPPVRATRRRCRRNFMGKHISLIFLFFSDNCLSRALALFNGNISYISLSSAKIMFFHSSGNSQFTFAATQGIQTIVSTAFDDLGHHS